MAKKRGSTTVRTTKRGGLEIKLSEADGRALAKQIREGKDPFEKVKPERVVAEAKIVSCWGQEGIGGCTIAWVTKDRQYGELTLTRDPSGGTNALTEYMDRDFCKKVLSKLMDDVNIADGPRDT